MQTISETVTMATPTPVSRKEKKEKKEDEINESNEINILNVYFQSQNTFTALHYIYILLVPTKNKIKFFKSQQSSQLYMEKCCIYFSEEDSFIEKFFQQRGKKNHEGYSNAKG